MRVRWLLATVLLLFNGWMLAALGRSLATTPPACGGAASDCDPLGAIRSVLGTGSAVFFICLGNAILVAVAPLLSRKRSMACPACLAQVPGDAPFCPRCGVGQHRRPVLASAIRAHFPMLSRRCGSPHLVLRIQRIAPPISHADHATAAGRAVRQARRP